MGNWEWGMGNRLLDPETASYSDVRTGEHFPIPRPPFPIPRFRSYPAMTNGKPRPAFFGAVVLVVIALVVLGLYRFGALNGVLGKTGGGGQTELPKDSGVEAPDAQGITTVKEYNYVPAQRLPE